MNSPLKLALLAALPIEAANLRWAGFPLEGLPDRTSWVVKVVAYQWLFLHYPGMLLLFHLSESRMDRQALSRIETPLLFVNGYCETVLLIVAIVLGVRWWLRCVQRKHPVGRT